MYTTTLKNKTITAISDTHGSHSKLIIAPCDILIHCGDACNDGNLEQLQDFFEWFSLQPSKYKIFVAGNHDLIFDLEPEEAFKFIPQNVHFIENQTKTIDGVTFGSIAVRPWIHQEIEFKKSIDVLITHAPPFSLLDNNLGCKKLHQIVNNIKPKLHLFGHIHETKQLAVKNRDTTFVNVCSL